MRWHGDTGKLPVGVTVFVVPVVAAIHSVSGCGANYQAVYEGEVRFEHCYRLDQEKDVPLTQRRECWREWTRFYTYGQTRDRIEYALRRQRTLTGTLSNPHNPGDTEEPDGGGSSAILAAPAPTDPTAPPPTVHPVNSAGKGEEADAGKTPPPKDEQDDIEDEGTPPGQACLIQCGRTWRSCKNACPKKARECASRCNNKFRTCAAKCL